MAAQLAICTKEEQHSVIRFLSSEGMKPVEIHRRMKVQNGDAMSVTTASVRVD